MGVEAGTTAQIQDFGWFSQEYLLVNPSDMLADSFKFPAGSVMILGEVFFKHPLAEVRVIPGDVIAFIPGEGNRFTVYQIDKFHGFIRVVRISLQ
jgi:hypothetical protein